MSNIVVTTGIYDLLKEYVHKRKATPVEAEVINAELKTASQVLRKELPEDVVAIQTKVTFHIKEEDKEVTIHFTNPQKARLKHGTTSIISPYGVALVGRREGDEIEWPFADGNKTLRILKIERV